MNYVFNYVILFVLIGRLYGQSTLHGLEPFVIGLTTPDSLNRFTFQEQELVVLKGTLALPCTDIRIFQTQTVRIKNTTISNLSLVFYENRLFRITCDYDEALQNAFIRQHGQGEATSTTLILCHERGPSKRLVLKSRNWQKGSIQALAISATGYNDRCQPERVSRLTIASLPVTAITSECDLDHLDPYVDKIWKKR
ncbi:hypothetical protein [Larkinella arboricola]